MTAALFNNTRGLAFRVLLWFARNPDEELTTTDILERWDLPPGTPLPKSLRNYREARLVNCAEAPSRLPSGGKALTWSAGPLLLEMLGCRTGLVDQPLPGEGVEMRTLYTLAESHEGRADDCGVLARAVLEAMRHQKLGLPKQP